MSERAEEGKEMMNSTVSAIAALHTGDVATHASDAHLVLFYMAIFVGVLAYCLSSRRFHQGKKIQKDTRVSHPL